MKQENQYMNLTTAMHAAVPVLANPIRLPQPRTAFPRRGF